PRRLDRLHAPIPCQVSVLVVEGLPVLRHRISEEIQQPQSHPLWALVELSPEKDVAFSLAVLDVVEFEVIKLQFFSCHTNPPTRPNISRGEITRQRGL